MYDLATDLRAFFFFKKKATNLFHFNIKIYEQLLELKIVKIPGPIKTKGNF